MEFTLTIKADERLLNAIERIADSFLGNSSAAPKKAAGKKTPPIATAEQVTAVETEVLGPVKETAESVVEPATAEAPEQAPLKQEETKGITIEELRSKVAGVTQSGKKDQVKKLLGEFNATKLGELAIADYTAFVAKLEKL